MFKSGMRPVHPGEVLREEYLIPLNLSPNSLANLLQVPDSRIRDIVCEKQGITTDIAELLASYFGGDAQSWLNLQSAYELRIVRLSQTDNCRM